MRKLFILLAFVIMLGCAKEPAKLSCDVIEQQIEQLDKQIINYSDQYASGTITFEQYVKEMDRLKLAITVYYDQLKDCE